MEVIKTIQELLSGKVVVLTDENLENFLQKCVFNMHDKEEDDRDYFLGLPRRYLQVEIFGCDLESFIEHSQQMESQRVA